MTTSLNASLRLSMLNACKVKVGAPLLEQSEIESYIILHHISFFFYASVETRCLMSFQPKALQLSSYRYYSYAVGSERKLPLVTHLNSCCTRSVLIPFSPLRLLSLLELFQNLHLLL